MQASWTRAISFKSDNLQSKHCFVIASDLLVAQGLPPNIKAEDMESWNPFFFPKDFVSQNFAILTENYSLDDNVLLELGKEVTNLRSLLRKWAEAKAIDEGKAFEFSNEQLTEAIKKIRTRRSTKEVKSVEYYYIKSFNQSS